MAEVTVPQAPPLVNLYDVELMHAGSWDLSSGPATFTTGDFAAAIGALDCPAVRNPVIKLGHTDARFDGEPAVGWVGNLRGTNDGRTLAGDLMGLPGWLAQVDSSGNSMLFSAYPDRSIEGIYDYRCQIGHTHPFVVTALALLGVFPPGIGTLTSLQDIASLYYGVDFAASLASAAGTPVAVTVHAKTAHAKEATAMPNPNPPQVAAGVTSEDVRRKYYESAGWSMWIVQMDLDPLQLIVTNDDDGSYSRIPLVLNGEDVEFGAAVAVEMVFVDKATPAGQGTPAAGAAPGVSRLVWASRAESRPGQEPAASDPVPTDPDGPGQVQPLIPTQPDGGRQTQPLPPSPADPDPADPAVNEPPTPPPAPDELPAAEPDNTPTEPEEDDVSALSDFRSQLGLADDADEQAISAKLAEVIEMATRPADPTATTEPTQQQTEPEPVAAGTQLPDGAVVVDADTLAELRAAAAEGRAAREQQRVEARDRALDEAVQAGKIAPARRDHWVKLWEADPDGTQQTLASLEPGLVVPVQPAGYTGGEPDSSAEDAEFDRLFSRPATTTKGA